MAKKPSKIENKTRPSLCLQIWLQQNLRISNNHKYRIYMDVFKTWCFVNLTFSKPDVLWNWHFVNLTFWNLTFWNLTFCGCTLNISVFFSYFESSERLLTEGLIAFQIKGAQAWDIRPLGFSCFLHLIVSTCGRLQG